MFPPVVAWLQTGAIETGREPESLGVKFYSKPFTNGWSIVNLWLSPHMAQSLYHVLILAVDAINSCTFDDNAPLFFHAT